MPNDTKGRVFLIIGLLLLSAISAGWTLSEAALDNHECFVSVTAREMLERGDWVMPTFNGQPRLQKTPLSYWLVAAIAGVAGKVDEFAARLPSAVFAVLSVCAVIYFVGRWLSFRTAIVCAAVWATSLGYVRYAHNARSEMVMTFFITVCFLSFYSAIVETGRRRQMAYMVVFWVSFGLANLAKGPAPIPLVFVPLFVYVTVFRQWKKVAKLLPLMGTVIFLVIVLPWPLAVAHKVNWDVAVWNREFVHRFFGEYAAGDYPWHYYFGIMFKYATPWCFFVPVVLAAPFYRVWKDKLGVMRYFWLWYVADFVFLTISGGKRQHYLLPLMPAMAVLTGIILDDMMFERRAFTVRQAKQVLAIHILALCLLAGGGVVYGACRLREFLPAILITAGVIVVGAFVVGVLFAKDRAGLAAGTMFTWFVAVIMVVFVWFVNPLDHNEPSGRFGNAVAGVVPSMDKLAAYRSVSPRFVHYFGRPVLEIEDTGELERLYQRAYWIVAFGGDLDELLKAGRFELVYRERCIEMRKQNAVAGGLFHRQ